MKKVFIILSTAVALSGCALKYVTPEPVIDTFSPANGKEGITVTIYGSCFGPQPSVKLNGIAASVTSVTSTSYTYSDKITFTVPTGASSGKIQVSTIGGSTVSGTNFVVVP